MGENTIELRGKTNNKEQKQGPERSRLPRDSGTTHTNNRMLMTGSGMMGPRAPNPKRFPGVGGKHILRKSPCVKGGKGQELPGAASATSLPSL